MIGFFQKFFCKNYKINGPPFWLLFCVFSFSVESVSTQKEIIELSPVGESEAQRDIARKKIKKARLKKEKSFRLPVLKTKGKKRKKFNLQAVEPPSTARMYHDRGSDEAELEGLYNEEINHLFQLLKTNKDSDLLLRLGSLYVEKARFITFKLQTDYDRKMTAFENRARKVKPRLNLQPAHVYNRKAIKLFSNFIAKHPHHARKDEVLFFLGFTSYQLGREASGAKYFAQLEKEFPRSVKLYEARFQMAEHYFSESKWSLAYNYYSKVSKSRRGKFYFLSLYKMAWVSYKLTRVTEALRFLSRVIKEGKIKANVSSEIRGFTFVEEAVQNLAFFYSYSNQSPSKAPSYFNNLLGRKKALLELKKLAYNYRDIGNTTGVVSLFSYLISVNPVSADAFEYKHQIVQALYESNKTGQLTKHIREWLNDYGYESPWAKANEDEASLVRKANAVVEVTLRDYALKNHQTFNRTKSNISKGLALSFYKLYFSHFKESKFSHEIRFFYGELLFDTGNYKRAAFQYERLIQKFPSSKYIKPAYLNQLLAMEKLLPDSSEIDRMTQGKGETPLSFPASIKKFTAVSLRYLKKLPRQKNSPTVLYRVASFYYNFNQFDKATVYFRRFFDSYPSSPHISNVGSILLELYSKSKNYKALEELAYRFARNKNTDGKLINEAKHILQQLAFKKAQDMALQGKFSESAFLYESFAKKNPSSTLASLAFFNAGINYEKHKNIKKAIAMYSSVLTYRDKKSIKQRNQANEFLPVLNEKLGFYGKAARGYSSYAVAFPKSKKAIPYWYNAGVIHDAFNEVDLAAQAYNNYYRLSKSPDRHEVLYQLGLLYERNNNWKRAIGYFKQYIQAPVVKKGETLKKVRASFKQAEIYQNHLRNKQKAKNWYQSTIALYRRFKAGTAYAAHSHFITVKKIYDRFIAIKIPKSQAAQKKAVAQKIAILKQLEQKLKPVIRYNEGEQILASLALIGLANEKMAEAIYRAPLPKGLDKAGKIQYRAGIKQVVTPYAQAARKSYQLALEKSGKLKVYSDWMDEVFSGLHIIRFDSASSRFSHFVKAPVTAEIMNFQLWDEMGTIWDSSIDEWDGPDSISKEELKRLTAAFKKGRKKEILQLLSNVLNRNPNHIPALSSLAFFYMKSNQLYKGRLIVNRILNINPKQPHLINNLGVMALKTGDIRQAVSYFKQALSMDSGYFIAKVNLGNIFLKNKDYENAHFFFNSAYKKALSKWGKNNKRALRILNNHGAALIGKMQWKPALKVFDRFSKKSSPPKEAIFNRAIILAQGFKGKKYKEKAKGLVDELSFYSNSANFNKKLNRLLAVIKE